MNSNSFNLMDIVKALSVVIDMVDEKVMDHHRQVAYVTLRLGRALGLSPEALRDAAMAALLHDVGAFRLSDRLPLLEFETKRTREHCLAGAHLMRNCRPLSHLAGIVEHHHRRFDAADGKTVPEASHLLHLADRIAVAIPQGDLSPNSVHSALRRSRAQSGRMFSPRMVEAFVDVASEEAFWFELVSKRIERSIEEETAGLPPLAIGLDEFRDVSFFICSIVDYRSPFTATHSRGVSACSMQLATELGLAPEENKILELSGLLHDVGKMAVPEEIIEKPGRLVDDEWWCMMQHPFYTRQVLREIRGIGPILEYAANHHVYPGKGSYPFHREKGDLPLGARIVTVADVFTALTEDRPYRVPLPAAEVVKLLRRMASQNKLQKDLAHLVMKRYDVFDDLRRGEQERARREYGALEAALRLDAASRKGAIPMPGTGHNL